MTRGRRSSSASRSNPSLSRSQSRGARSKSRGPSTRSKSRGPPLSRRSSPPSPPAEKDHGPDIKNSLLFLGTIAAAAFTAHKVWPKGVIFGGKDDWEHEHEHKSSSSSSSSRKPSHHHHQQRSRDRDDDRAAAPRYRAPAEADRPVYQSTTRAKTTTPQQQPWSESRRQTLEATARSAPLPFESDRASQSTGSTPPAPRRYLPYEPGVYTPSSVASSNSTNARALFEQRRERPVLLPMGALPSVPMAPPAAAARRGTLFEDEGYASRESVPAARSFAPRYQAVEEVEYRR
ncbi:hypothetical protein QBC39DRAFT_433320 [Podospora conica]|nr:hypothetical protein QBC39DRAFT_433320 [Schizothecium conicum]